MKIGFFVILISLLGGCSDDRNEQFWAVEKPMGGSIAQDKITGFGRTLKIIRDPVTNKLAFGAVYTLESDPDGMSLILTFKTDITDDELSHLPEEMHWNMLGTHLVVNPATAEGFRISKSSLKIGQIRVKNSYSLARAILSLKDGLLLFGTTPESTISDPNFNLEVGTICKSDPNLFANLSTYFHKRSKKIT